MTFPAVGAPLPINNIAPTTPKSWDSPGDRFTLKSSKDKFIESVTKDLNSGQLSPEVNRMAEAVLSPGKPGLPKVQVKTFAVDGIQAKDIMFIQRVPPVPEGPNVVLFIPDDKGGSFLPFKTVEDMNAGLKKLAGDPQWLQAFSAHFAVDVLPEKKKRVIDTMIDFKYNKINAIVGPYANEGVDIFARLDKGTSEPPTAVNGLTNLQEEHTSPDGRVLYSGLLPDGKKIYYQYDSYGNLLGSDKKDVFVFVKNGLNSHKPVVPLTEREASNTLYDQSMENVGADDLRGLYEELLTHLEHPFSGIADALNALGINKKTADTVERYLDNPFSALLLDLNKSNQIGNVFGVDKATMNSVLKGVGDIAQGFVPFYGQARGLGTLLAKAIRNEPMTKQEVRDMADAMALKPNSPARKNLAASEPIGKPARLPSSVQEAQTKAPLEKPPVTPGNVEILPRPHAYPGFKEIELGGTKYFVAETPDAVDGVHYQLWEPDPNTPSKLMKAEGVAKLDDSGAWALGEALPPPTGAAKDMQAMVLDGETFYTYKKPNNMGHYELYRIDPNNPEKITSANQFATHESGQWTRVGLRGGGRLSRILSPKYKQAGEALDSTIEKFNRAFQAIKNGHSVQSVLTEKELKTFGGQMSELEGSNAELFPHVEDYVHADSDSFNEPLRAGQTTLELTAFLNEFEQLKSYKGTAYRSAFVTPEGAERIKNGVGQVFLDDGVQSGSVSAFNSADWEGWATNVAHKRGNASQPVVFVMDETIPKKNLSTGFLPDHVAVGPKTPMKVLSVKEQGGRLFVYMTAPTGAPEHAYNIYNGNKAY